MQKCSSMRNSVFQQAKRIRAAIISCVFFKTLLEIVFCENVSYFLWCEIFLKILKMMVCGSSQTKPNFIQIIVVFYSMQTTKQCWNKKLEAIHRRTPTAVVYKRVTFIVTKTQQERTKAATVFCLVDFSHTKRQLLLSIHKVACCFCTV